MSNVNSIIKINNREKLNNLLNIILLEVLEEKRKRKRKKKKNYDPNYLKGTKKSNKQMKREINKCAKKPRPKSCYDEWTADKTYKKSRNTQYMSELNLEENETNNTEYIDDLILKEIDLYEKRKRKKKKKSSKLSSKTRETLRKKAKKANMPTGALSSVYRKGLAAWLTGHRQGVPQHAWAMARVNSFIRGGKTRSVDKSEWKRVQDYRKRN